MALLRSCLNFDQWCDWTNGWECFCLNCGISYVNDLLVKSVPWRYGRKIIVAPSRSIEILRAVYSRMIYFYLIQFSGMLRCWFQRLYRIPFFRTFGTPSYLIIFLTNEHFEYDNQHSITLYMYITTIFLIKTVKMNTFALPPAAFRFVIRLASFWNATLCNGIGFLGVSQ